MATQATLRAPLPIPFENITFGQSDVPVHRINTYIDENSYTHITHLYVYVQKKSEFFEV